MESSDPSSDCGALLGQTRLSPRHLPADSLKDTASGTDGINTAGDGELTRLTQGLHVQSLADKSPTELKKKKNKKKENF